MVGNFLARNKILLNNRPSRKMLGLIVVVATLGVVFMYCQPNLAPLVRGK